MRVTQAEDFRLEPARLLVSVQYSHKQTGQIEAAHTCPLIMVGPPSPSFPSPFLLPLLDMALGRGVSVTRAACMPLRAERRGCLSVVEAVKLVLGLLHGSAVLRPSMAHSCISDDVRQVWWYQDRGGPRAFATQASISALQRANLFLKIIASLDQYRAKKVMRIIS